MFYLTIGGHLDYQSGHSVSWLAVHGPHHGSTDGLRRPQPVQIVPSVKIKIAVVRNGQWTEDRLLKSVPVWGSSIGYK